jgi:glycosyltransferase involved in cell wall biosynthesis
MFRSLKVGVVIPAYNEEERVGRTISTIPSTVDEIIVVDDSSGDATFLAATSSADSRTRIVRHSTNRGVGGAILTGYREALRRGLNAVVVMAGDGQMDPDDLPALLSPIVDEGADYVKGNRFLHSDVVRRMPGLRLAGNLALSYLTRLASGYPDIMDSQCGYTAVTAGALQSIDFDAIYPRYGFPNDFLAHLHTAGARVAQVKVRPVYEGEESGINPLLAIGPLGYVLLRSRIMRAMREGRRPSAARTEA